MLKDDRADLDYSHLVKMSKHLVANNALKLKIALIADVSTQHITPLLRALFSSNGVDADIYEASYDTVEQESLSPSSGMYAFGPQIVLIIQSVEKLKSSFYVWQGNRTDFEYFQISKTMSVWKSIQLHCKVPILQSTFVIPVERPYGNYGFKVASTLQSVVTDINRALCLKAGSEQNIFINDVDNLASWVGRSNFIDEKMWALSKSLCAFKFLPDVAQNIVDISLAACFGKGVKCVILDLDNTLWGGVLGDDGLEGIALGDLDAGNAFRNFQFFLKELFNRGIILAVCSKNNEENARSVFKKHPGMVLREEDIAIFIANWDDKVTNIHKIKERLNIGFEAIVFLDDNPFERNLVRKYIPEIIVPELPEDPGLYVRTINELNLFETAAHSELDKQRNSLYQEQLIRDEKKQIFSGNVDDYLRSLNTYVIFSRFTPINISRIAQLILRSNQFNLTTKRYTELECITIMDDNINYFPITINVKDIFGDFGLVVVVVLRLRKAFNEIEIDSFLMSCRVLQRGIETYAMNKIFEYAISNGYSKVIGMYKPTSKNKMVADFYKSFGFETYGVDQALNNVDQIWSLKTSKYIPKVTFISES